MQQIVEYIPLKYIVGSHWSRNGGGGAIVGISQTKFHFFGNNLVEKHFYLDSKNC